VKICTWLPPFSGFTKIVSAASPRFRFSIEEAAVNQIAAFLSPALGLEIRGQFGTDDFHVPLALSACKSNHSVTEIFKSAALLSFELL
jgi:hypothetical protein